MRSRFLMVALLAGLAVATTAMRSSYAKDELSMQDKSFLKKAAQSGHFEMQASKLALEKSQNQQVKDFAQVMVREHKLMADELAGIAQTRNYELPDKPSMMQRAKLTLLENEDGEKFDETYTREVAVKAHEDAISDFESYAEKGKNSELTGFAQDSLTMLRQHLQHGHLLQNQILGKDMPASAQPGAQQSGANSGNGQASHSGNTGNAGQGRQGAGSQGGGSEAFPGQNMESQNPVGQTPTGSPTGNSSTSGPSTGGQNR